MGVKVGSGISEAVGVTLGVGISLDGVQDESTSRMPIPAMRKKINLRLFAMSVSLP
jgi:hypothetical protein